MDIQQAVSDFLDDLKQELPAFSESKTVDRNDYLTREGQIESYIYYIDSGAVRVIYQTELEEHTIRFGYSGSFINSVESFLSGVPSRFYLQAIRKTQVLRVKRSDFFDFVNKTQERRAQYTRFLEFSFILQMDREIDLLTFSPLERVQRILNRSPQVFQEIPAKYIASYLRMTPETLSRILKS